MTDIDIAVFGIVMVITGRFCSTLPESKLVSNTPVLTDTGKFKTLLDAVYHERLREFPEYATYHGIHSYDDKLEAFTIEAFDRRKDTVKRWLAEAALLKTESLSRVDKRELRILQSYLRTFLNGYQWRDYGPINTVNFLEGIVNGPQWPYYSRLDSLQSLQNYTRRLASVPSQIDEQMTFMKRAIRLERTNHIVSMDRVPALIDQLRLHSIYMQPFQTGLRKVPLTEPVKVNFLQEAHQSVSSIIKAMKGIKKFIEQEYIPATRKVEGVHSLSHGLRYYQSCLDWYLGVRLSPQQIFDLGVKEVARIEGNIRKVMETVGFSGDLKSFFQYVKLTPSFYNHSKAQLLNRYNHLLNKVIEPKLSKLFFNADIPTVTVIPIENDGPWGSYGQNMFYVNLREPRRRSTFTMIPLALHETNPGHHFQESYARRFSIPSYRAENLIGRLFSVPFHFPVYSAYAEGLALYAEYLGEEIGLFEDPYNLFGRYCSEIFRACRLVIDSGIHAFGWTRERAISFLANYSDFPLTQISAEVDRYITWPGQACAYKVGEIKIKELRQKAEQELGRRFDVKGFHHVVLKVGHVSLDILEEVVLEWIELKKRRRRKTYQPTPPLTTKRLISHSQNNVMSHYLTIGMLTMYILAVVR